MWQGHLKIKLVYQPPVDALILVIVILKKINMQTTMNPLLCLTVNVWCTCPGATSHAGIRAVELGANDCLQADPVAMQDGNDSTGGNAGDQPMDDLLNLFYDSEVL